MTDIHVTQADREAAENALRGFLAMIHGEDDGSTLTQAFARHRIEALRQSSEREEKLREAWVALKEWLEPIAGDNCDLKASQNEVETFNAMEAAIAALEATNG